MRVLQSRPIFASTALLLFASTAVAQGSILESFSFGYKTDLSSDGHTISGWTLSGDGHDPQVLSDRVVLTPPAPGNKRGALWSDAQLTDSDWVVEVDFRASGPERGSGNLQLWLTRERTIGAGGASVYTVDRFDGLALELDQYGGQGGAIRGFLSDGSVSFKNHHAVDGLAFGHCDYAYRNLGRMSKLHVKQDQGGLEVTIDERPCFKSDQIQIPPGYYLGLSAASAETPDSFEVSKLVVIALRGNSAPPPPSNPDAAAVPSPAQGGGGVAQTSYGNGFSSRTSAQIDETQLRDLLNRLDTATSSINTVYEEIKAVDQRLGQRYDELKNSVSNIPGHPTDLLNLIFKRLELIEKSVQRIQEDVEGRDYGDHLTNLHSALMDTQESLLSSLPASMSQIVSTSAPRLGLFVFVVLFFQIMLAGAYIVYKKRRSNSPKKLL